MGKLRVLLVIIGFFIVAFAVGQHWKLKPESAVNHVVRTNETAILQRAGNAPVWLCLRKEDAYPMQQAMVAGRAAELQEAADANTAFPVESGAMVKVLGASVDKRFVQVQTGPQSGKSGWVEFEYLRPARPFER